MEKTKPNRNINSKNDSLNVFIKVQIFALLCYVLLFFIGTFIGLKIDLPTKYDFIFSLVIFALSSFIVGFYAGMRLRKNGLINGILYSLPINIVTIVVSLIISQFAVGANLIITSIVLVVASGTGGILAVNKRLR